jgi:CRISPR-associated protein Cmr6
MNDPISLVRNCLRGLIQDTRSAHAGLLIQRGWTDFVKSDSDNQGAGGKAEHIARICDIPAPDLYKRAYARWVAATGDAGRFLCFETRIANRLLIGLSGGGALETGCAVGQTYGMPYLPGSSVKGLARAYLTAAPNGNKHVLAELFGCEACTNEPDSLSGAVAFHDAWWVPGSGAPPRADKPFVADVVTPHHSAYYGSEGAEPATDLDSPVPNAIIGVHGSFRFTLEGPPDWTRLAKRLLELALADCGIGAKTRAGYGYMEAAKHSALESTQSGFVEAKLRWNAGTRELGAILMADNRKTAPLRGAAAKAMLDKLPPEARNGPRIRDGRLIVEIRVKETGNLLELTDVREKPAP